MKKNFFGFRLLAAGLCGILLFSGCGGQQERQEQEAPELIEPVDVTMQEAYAQRRDVYNLDFYESVVLPRLEELSFESSGTLKELYVKIGDTVEKGQVLALLDNGAEANYESLAERLEKMRADNEYSNRLSEISIEIARLSGQDATLLEMQLRHAKELQELEESRLLAQIETAQGQIEGTQIVAPFAGTVVALANSVGNTVSEGSAVIAIAAENETFLTCDYISESAIESCDRYYAIIRGKEYELEYLPYSDEELAAATAAGTRMSTFSLRAGDAMSLGENAFICIVRNFRENVITVPNSALYKEGRNYYVYIVQGEMRVLTSVTVGVSGVMYSEITEGLEEGACVYVKE